MERSLLQTGGHWILNHAAALGLIYIAVVYTPKISVYQVNFLTIRLTSEDNCYMVENKKGMASYMTFHIYERYNFMYKGEAYEASLLILYQKEDDTSDLTDKNKKVIFESADIEFDREKSFVALKNYLYIKTGENIDISNTRELDLSFYDYKNEGHTFEYHEYEGEIHLVSTEKNDFAPSHNVTVIIRDEAQLEEQIEYAVDCLI